MPNFGRFGFGTSETPIFSRPGIFRSERFDGLLRQRPRTRRERGGSAAPTARRAGGGPRETYGGDRGLQGGVVRGPGEARFGRERCGGRAPYVSLTSRPTRPLLGAGTSRIPAPLR